MRGSRNAAQPGLQTADHVFGTFEQTKPIILSRLQNHFSVQDNKVMHAISKRDSVMSTRRQGGPGSLEPSIDVQKLPPVLQDMKFVKKHISNARVMLSPMRKSHDQPQGVASGHLVGSAHMVEAEQRALGQHHQGSPGGTADDQANKHVSSQVMKLGAGLAREEGDNNQSLQQAMDAEQAYNAGRKEQRAQGALAIPKVNVKVTSNGKLCENADQLALATGSNPRFPHQAQKGSLEKNEALGASARLVPQGQAGLRLSPYLVEKMAKQIRALS